MFYLILAFFAFSFGRQIWRLVKDASHSGRWTDWLMAALMITPLLLLAIFFVSSLILHGDALMGTIKNGRYFVTMKGSSSEVTHNQLYLSLWLGRVMIASFLLALAVSLLAGVWQRPRVVR